VVPGRRSVALGTEHRCRYRRVRTPIAYETRRPICGLLTSWNRVMQTLRPAVADATSSAHRPEAERVDLAATCHRRSR
jgi:hypothetical protein